MQFTGRRGRRGGSALEVAFFLPWYVFLFVGAFDWGFYAHALISTENATRVAVLYTSTTNNPTDSATACTYALEELRIINNIGSGLTTCNALPVIVTATQVTGPDSQPAAQVTVEYQTQQLIPIPGVLPGQATLYRAIQMKL